jgi:uncharacterized membrane protein
LIFYVREDPIIDITPHTLEDKVKSRAFSLLFIGILLISTGIHVAQAQGPVVRAVLFFAPTCEHCHQVMEVDLPLLVEKYGDQLDIVGIDTSQPAGVDLYQSMSSYYKLPDERIGVPALVVGSQVLVGSKEIPEKFPAIIEDGLAAGGIDWPTFPGLAEVLAAQPTKASAPVQATVAPPAQQSEQYPMFVQKFFMDPTANTIALVVLFGMILSVIAVIYSFIQGEKSKFIHFPDWVIPVLAVIGMGVALYLSYIEITKTEAICGPVGNCNSVQESPYARLFGILPIGVMGIFGYIAILGAWLIKKFGPQSLNKTFTLMIWGFSWFGILFSIYLTFLEPFVIGATCAWCITSAIVITLIFLASTEPAKQAFKLEEMDEEDFDETDEGDGQAETSRA